MAHTLNSHELLQKQLQEMSNEDMQQMLLQDPLVQAVLSAVPESERSKIEAFAIDFLNGWKDGAVDPIIKMASNPDFVKALMKTISANDPDMSNLGDIL